MIAETGSATPNALDLIGLVLGSSFAAGINLYATVLIVGLVQLAGWAELPAGLSILAQPVVLGVAGVMFLVEFLADKIPFVDSLWDAVHTVVRPLAAAAIAFGAFSQAPDSWQLGAALLGGYGHARTASATIATQWRSSRRSSGTRSTSPRATSSAPRTARRSATVPSGRPSTCSLQRFYAAR